MNGFFEYFVKYYVNLEMGVNYPLQMVFFCITITLSMNTLKWDRKGILLKITDLILTFMLQVFFFCLFEYLFGSHNYINYITWPFVLLFHCFCFTKEAIFDQIAKSMTLLIFIFLLPQFTANLINVSGNPMSGNFPLYASILAILLCSLWSACFLLFQIRKKKNSKVSLLSFLVLLFALGFSIAVIVTDNPERNRYLNSMSHIFLYALLMFLSLATYSLFFKANLYHTSSYESEKMALRLEADNRMVNLSRENLERLRRIRHDTKNQYQFMKMLIDRGEYGKLKEFCQEMLKKDIELSQISTQNQDVDEIITKEREELKKEKIFLEVCSSGLSQCRIRKEELSTFFEELTEYLKKEVNAFLSEDLSLHGDTLILRLDFQKTDKETTLPLMLKERIKEDSLEDDRRYMTFYLR